MSDRSHDGVHDGRIQEFFRNLDTIGSGGADLHPRSSEKANPTTAP